MLQEVGGTPASVGARVSSEERGEIFQYGVYLFLAVDLLGKPMGEPGALPGDDTEEVREERQVPATVFSLHRLGKTAILQSQSLKHLLPKSADTRR